MCLDERIFKFEKLKVPYILQSCSALTGKGVKEGFDLLANFI